MIPANKILSIGFEFESSDTMTLQKCHKTNTFGTSEDTIVFSHQVSKNGNRIFDHVSDYGNSFLDEAIGSISEEKKYNTRITQGAYKSITKYEKKDFKPSKFEKKTDHWFQNAEFKILYEKVKPSKCITVEDVVYKYFRKALKFLRKYLQNTTVIEDRTEFINSITQTPYLKNREKDYLYRLCVSNNTYLYSHVHPQVRMLKKRQKELITENNAFLYARYFPQATIGVLYEDLYEVAEYFLNMNAAYSETTKSSPYYYRREDRLDQILEQDMWKDARNLTKAYFSCKVRTPTNVKREEFAVFLFFYNTMGYMRMLSVERYHTSYWKQMMFYVFRYKLGSKLWSTPEDFQQLFESILKFLENYARVSAKEPLAIFREHSFLQEEVKILQTKYPGHFEDLDVCEYTWIKYSVLCKAFVEYTLFDVCSIATQTQDKLYNHKTIHHTIFKEIYERHGYIKNISYYDLFELGKHSCLLPWSETEVIFEMRWFGIEAFYKLRPQTYCNSSKNPYKFQKNIPLIDWIRSVAKHK